VIEQVKIPTVEGCREERGGQLPTSLPLNSTNTANATDYRRADLVCDKLCPGLRSTVK